jgi:hypothetical protein
MALEVEALLLLLLLLPPPPVHLPSCDSRK